MNKKYLLLIILAIGLLIILENVRAVCLSVVVNGVTCAQESEKYCCSCTGGGGAEYSVPSLEANEFNIQNYESFGSAKPLNYLENLGECECGDCFRCVLVHPNCGQYYYADSDADSYISSVVSGQYLDIVTNPLFSVFSGLDCNDGVFAIHPGATESCNNLDDDCDGKIDEEGACCQITGVSLTSGTFGKDQSITATITYAGDCSAANLAQVDLYDINNGCKIQYSGFNMTGITNTTAVFSISGGTTSITYTIPIIPDVCAGKLLTKIDAAVWKGVPGTGYAVSNYYSGTFAGITLNQCYGYTTTSYLSNKYKLIKNSNNCYYMSCYNYKLYSVNVNYWT